MTPIRHVVYLHGFASSPLSSKATWFERELTVRGVGYSCPDFNDPAFETLTVTRMLGQVRDAIAAVPEGPVALVGSSLGAFVALHAAAADATGRVDRLVLLAPAIDFGGNRLRQLGEHGIDEWRRSGSLRLFHYGYNESRDVSFALYEDASRYDAFAVPVRQPALVVQGRHDALVDAPTVERWASSRPAVDLRLVDDGHQLTASMPFIWRESARLFGLDA
ncbi:MAG: YqiA/YcfP family alpha/beta fold hydrolase [Acidobacteriota bacterium]